MNKKNAYKCMKKTCIQKYEQNTYKCMKKQAYKHAYKCMTKTRIQTRTQMYEKNILKYWSSGQPITASRERLAQGHLSQDKEVNCHASSCLPTNPFVEQ